MFWNEPAGLAQLVGIMGLNTDLVGLAFDKTTQTLYADDGTSGTLYQLDTSTGAASRIGLNKYAGIDGLAWIPEPASLSLLAIGSLVFLRRR